MTGPLFRDALAGAAGTQDGTVPSLPMRVFPDATAERPIRRKDAPEVVRAPRVAPPPTAWTPGPLPPVPVPGVPLAAGGQPSRSGHQPPLNPAAAVPMPQPGPAGVFAAPPAMPMPGMVPPQARTMRSQARPPGIVPRPGPAQISPPLAQFLSRLPQGLAENITEHLEQAQTAAAAQSWAPQPTPQAPPTAPAAPLAPSRAPVSPARPVQGQRSGKGGGCLSTIIILIAVLAFSGAGGEIIEAIKTWLDSR